ncbi:MAG: hypothetical protein Q8L55_04255 [Phycisphaerales bacterium]|nr:hypothetical protein [Phycisphaerales bacterium]
MPLPTRLSTSTLLRYLRASHGAALVDLQTYGADGNHDVRALVNKP